MSTFAKRERLLLADLLETAGPDAPTLCEGWRTRDLAAHVVVRERRPDTVGGQLIKQLAPRLQKVMEEYTAKPYEELIPGFREEGLFRQDLRLSQGEFEELVAEFY